MNLQEKVYPSLSLYVHVPFCANPCDYCAFYKEKPCPENIALYTESLLLELDTIQDERAFETIYFGGGTPGILSEKWIAIIAQKIASISLQKPLEWTVELSPSTVNAHTLKAWQSAGVNRISMGVQSFNAKTLQTLGRKQSPLQIFKAYEQIRQAGFQNVGIDLIFSEPGQTKPELLEDLKMAVDLQPEHISTYCLTYEPETKLFDHLGNAAQEERDHDFYDTVCDFLPQHGYPQYEISNFCKPGFASIHNVNTWKMQEWIGVGPSASTQYKNERYTNINSLERWSKGIQSKHFERRDCVSCDPMMMAADAIIFGLRMNAGIDIGRNPLSQKLAKLFSFLKQEHLLIQENNNIRLTSRGRFLCDAIAVEILDAVE